MPDTSIRRVHARRVWDSRGRPTVEVEITTGNGAMGRAIAPAGASMGSGEAVDRRDGGSAFGGLDVQDALRAIRTEIAPAVAGMDAADQAGVDGRLIQLDGTPNKSRLGGNATIAVSMAAAHATAAAHDMPLWRWLAGSAADGPVVMPLPEIQIFGGGAHADARVDLQDFMVVCPGAASFAQALDWTAEVYRAAGALMAADGRRQGVADEGGWWPVFADNEEAIATLARAIEKAGFQPGEEVAIALDVAASQFGRDGAYRLRLDERDYGRDEWAERVAGWVDRHPIVSVEDPMGEDDPAGMAAVTAAIGDRALVVGDDFLVTSAQRIQTAAADRACNAALIKPNQAGTLTETKAAFDAARAAGMRTIVSARSGETEDVTVVHLAVGWQADQLKVGSFARSERMAKWNEALRIEEALGERARFRAARIFPRTG
ncbi:enolase [Stella humosa]|uniref:Enolase n=1 Tax=Stella humosa TaxID=94 RepID=A0A3N1KQJ5_9PROT|nr:phosphopyruvate hydratase [Stella humosa]ROP81059.1 enolase [Stella humosa]BBK29749.1 enolase [Stella humosa]